MLLLPHKQAKGRFDSGARNQFPLSSTDRISVYGTEDVGSNPTEETSLFHHSSMVEHSAVNRRVVGSSPTGGAMWAGSQVGRRRRTVNPLRKKHRWFESIPAHHFCFLRIWCIGNIIASQAIVTGSSPVIRSMWLWRNRYTLRT